MSMGLGTVCEYTETLTLLLPHSGLTLKPIFEKCTVSVPGVIWETLLSHYVALSRKSPQVSCHHVDRFRNAALLASMMRPPREMYCI